MLKNVALVKRSWGAVRKAPFTKLKRTLKYAAKLAHLKYNHMHSDALIQIVNELQDVRLKDGKYEIQILRLGLNSIDHSTLEPFNNRRKNIPRCSKILFTPRR